MVEADKLKEGWESGRKHLFKDGKPIYRYQFRAMVLPEAGDLPGFNDWVLGFEADDSNHCLFQLNINNRVVEVDLETQSEDWLTVKNHLSSIVHIFVDGWGFLTAQGFKVELTSVTHPDGNEGKINSRFPRLVKDTEDLEVAFNKIVAVVASEDKMAQHSLRRALADYREGIKTPLDTGFFAYRAIEDIMQFFNKTNQLKAKKAWTDMRQELQIDEDVLYFVEESFAAAQRHGKIITMSEDDRVNCLLIVREVINRFCNYCNGGFKKISAAPVLKLSDFGITGFSKKKGKKS